VNHGQGREGKVIQTVLSVHWLSYTEQTGLSVSLSLYAGEAGSLSAGSGEGERRFQKHSMLESRA
jgi:hypothetical protein